MVNNKKLKGREKKRIKQDVKSQPQHYTKDERQRKVTNIMMQLIQVKMDHTLPEYSKNKLHEFVNDGIDYIEDIDLPAYSRTMKIHFVNDKNRDKENSINLIFNKVRVDNNNPDNPINKLNEVQEHML